MGFYGISFVYICSVLTNVNKTEFWAKPGTCPRERALPVRRVLVGHVFTAEWNMNQLTEIKLLI